MNRVLWSHEEELARMTSRMRNGFALTVLMCTFMSAVYYQFGRTQGREEGEEKIIVILPPNHPEMRDDSPPLHPVSYEDQ